MTVHLPIRIHGTTELIPLIGYPTHPFNSYDPAGLASDMLFEQIPAYLEYFGLPTTTAEVLRSVARLTTKAM